MTVRGETVRVYTARDGEAWDALVAEAWRHDFYHLSGYHVLAEERGEGEARLVEYRSGTSWVALPVMLVRTRLSLGLEELTVTDATSVYGYAGALTSAAQVPATVRAGFHRALEAELGRLGVCTVFSRLHPFLAQPGLLKGLGEIVPVGTTVSIDLTLDPADQRRRYRKNHKRGINKLRRAGVECRIDDGEAYLGRFVEIYQETMRRVQAREKYFFDLSYFQRLLTMRRAEWRLGVCLRDGEVLCGGVFSLCGGIIQYHLGGTASDSLKDAPMKLLFDEVRLWGTTRGAWVFHLGGGVGAKEDSLFSFKAGFSERRHTFAVWRWVRDRELYESLVARRRGWTTEQGMDDAAGDFFPAHRAPLPSAPRS